MWDDCKKDEMEKMAYIEREQKAFSEQEEAKAEEELSPAPKPSKRGRIQYYVDGERVTPRKASAVAEDVNYMADYVYGKGGRISEIHFDRIKPR